MAGLRVVHIPYKGGAPALMAVVGGEAHLIFGASAPTLPLVKSGKLRALAITSARSSVLYSGLPTLSQSLPGYEANLLLGIFAPAKTPDAIISRLTGVIAEDAKRSEIRDRFLNAGVEIEAGS